MGPPEGSRAVHRRRRQRDDHRAGGAGRGGCRRDASGGAPPLRRRPRIPRCGPWRRSRTPAASSPPTRTSASARLLRHLGRRLSREGSDRAGPAVLLVVDRLAGWRLDVAARLGPELADLLDRILVEGPSAASSSPAGSIGPEPCRWPCRVRWANGSSSVWRTPRRGGGWAAAGLGGRPPAGSGLPGRRRARAAGGASRRSDRDRRRRGEAVGVDRRGRSAAGDAGASPIRVAEDELLGGFAVRARLTRRDVGGSWVLPVGVDGETLGPRHVELHSGDHLLVAGPARSGRSSTLGPARSDGRAGWSRPPPSSHCVPRELVPTASAVLQPFSPCSTVAELAAAVGRGLG